MATKGRDVTIRELVDRIVDGKRGAIKSLDELHDTLESELEAATDARERQRIKDDLQYLEGYQETPAAVLADLHARRKRAIA